MIVPSFLCFPFHAFHSLPISLFFRASGSSDSSQPCGLFEGVCACVFASVYVKYGCDAI